MLKVQKFVSSYHPESYAKLVSGVLYIIHEMLKQVQHDRLDVFFTRTCVLPVILNLVLNWFSVLFQRLFKTGLAPCHAEP